MPVIGGHNSPAARQVFGRHKFMRPIVLGALGGGDPGRGSPGPPLVAQRHPGSLAVRSPRSVFRRPYSAGADSSGPDRSRVVGNVRSAATPAEPVSGASEPHGLVFVTSAFIDGRSLDVGVESRGGGARVYTSRCTYGRGGGLYSDGCHLPPERHCASPGKFSATKPFTCCNGTPTTSSWQIPLSGRSCAVVPGGGSLSRFLDLGVLSPTSALLLAQQIPYDRQPWEREAYLLTTGRPNGRTALGILHGVFFLATTWEYSRESKPLSRGLQSGELYLGPKKKDECSARPRVGRLTPKLYSSHAHSKVCSPSSPFDHALWVDTLSLLSRQIVTTRGD